MLTCPMCGRCDSSRPVYQVWDEGRSFVTVADETREWTEELLTPLARRVAPPEAPRRRWLLVLAAGSVLFTGVFGTASLVVAPVLLVLYAVENVRNEVKVPRAHGVWRQMWYCHGCDYVWLPGSRRRPVPSYAARRMVWWVA